MNPKLLRALADMLENPEELARKADQAKGRLLELAARFDQEKPHANNEDMTALTYGLAVVLSTGYDVLKQMEGLEIMLQMAHRLGKNKGRRLGYKQAQTERLFQNVKGNNE